MKRVVLVAVTLSLVVGEASASVVTVEDGSADLPYQVWLDAAKAPIPPRVFIIERPCPGADQPCVNTPPLDAAIYFPARMFWVGPAPSARLVFLHEIGHIYGWQRFGNLGEMFAERYAQCARWPRSFPRFCRWLQAHQ